MTDSLYTRIVNRLKAACRSFAQKFFSDYTKRQIVMSSAVQYFGDIDYLDNANIERVNKLLKICNHNYTSMQLPMLLSRRIWYQVPIDYIRFKSESVDQAVNRLYQGLPEWLYYKGVKNDLKEIVTYIQKQPSFAM